MPLDEELLEGRKGKSYGVQTRIAATEDKAELSPIVVVLMKEVFFLCSKNNSKENIFLSSAKELKKVQALSVCAMFAALSLILKNRASITIGPHILKSVFPVFQTSWQITYSVLLPAACLREFWML